MIFVMGTMEKRNVGTDVEVRENLKDMVSKIDMPVDEFMEKNYGMVWAVVNTFRGVASKHPDLTIEDIEQLGALGLYRTYKTFEPSYGFTLSTYGYKTIRNEILRGFRNYDSNGGVKFSRIAKEICARHLFNRETEITKEYLKEVQEIEGATDYIMDSVVAYFEHFLHGVVALNKPSSDTHGNSDELIEMLDLNTHEEVIKSEIPVLLFRDTLKGREAQIFDELAKESTQKEIGEKVGVSQVHVSRVRRKLYKDYQAFVVENGY